MSAKPNMSSNPNMPSKPNMPSDSNPPPPSNLTSALEANGDSALDAPNPHRRSGSSNTQDTQKTAVLDSHLAHVYSFMTDNTAIDDSAPNSPVAKDDKGVDSDNDNDLMESNTSLVPAARDDDRPDAENNTANSRSRRMSNGNTRSDIEAGNYDLQDGPSNPGQNLSRMPTEVRKATDGEDNMTIGQACRIYGPGVLWSLLFSTTVIMEGYDLGLMGALFALPQFNKKYGSFVGKAENGKDIFRVDAPMKAGLTVGALAGEIVGLLLCGVASERYGYRKTMIFALGSMIGVIFIPFFAPNVRVLIVGQVLCGIPWGVFQTCKLFPYSHSDHSHLLTPSSTCFLCM